MKDIPKLIPNKGDGDDRCVSAVIMSLYEFFFDEAISFDELDEIMRYEKGKDTWSFPAYLLLKKKGIEIINIESFDAERYMKDGIAYIEAAFDKNTSEWLINKSNLNNVADLLPAFIKLITHHTRKPTQKDLEEMLSDGYLVLAMVNLRTLNGEQGFTSHCVLVTHKDEQSYYINDPGLPALQRKISKMIFLTALNEVGELTGFKKG